MSDERLESVLEITISGKCRDRIQETISGILSTAYEIAGIEELPMGHVIVKPAGKKEAADLYDGGNEYEKVVDLIEDIMPTGIYHRISSPIIRRLLPPLLKRIERESRIEQSISSFASRP